MFLYLFFNKEQVIINSNVSIFMDHIGLKGSNSFELFIILANPLSKVFKPLPEMKWHDYALISSCKSETVLSLAKGLSHSEMNNSVEYPSCMVHYTLSIAHSNNNFSRYIVLFLKFSQCFTNLVVEFLGN